MHDRSLRLHTEEGSLPCGKSPPQDLRKDQHCRAIRMTPDPCRESRPTTGTDSLGTSPSESDTRWTSRAIGTNKASTSSAVVLPKEQGKWSGTEGALIGVLIGHPRKVLVLKPWRGIDSLNKRGHLCMDMRPSLHSVLLPLSERKRRCLILYSKDPQFSDRPRHLPLSRLEASGSCMARIRD